MIRRLRWKITGVTMLVAFMVLLAVFGGVYFFSQANIAQSYIHQLKQAVQTGVVDGRFPCFVAEVLPSGTVRVSGSSYYDLDDEEALLDAVSQALADGGESGVLSQRHLRFYRQDGVLTVRIAFMDSTFEQATLRSLVKVCLLIGLGALLVLLGVSWLLSGFVSRPVVRTWQDQQQFISDASHELKTPLTVILSSADLLEESASGEQQRYVDNILAESRRMKELVEDMLTLSRTSAASDVYKRQLPDGERPGRRALCAAGSQRSGDGRRIAVRAGGVRGGTPAGIRHSERPVPDRRLPTAGSAGGYPAGQRREIRRARRCHPPDAERRRKECGAGGGEPRREDPRREAVPPV